MVAGAVVKVAVAVVVAVAGIEQEENPLNWSNDQLYIASRLSS